MSRTLLLILLILWFILGWWLCRKYICGISAVPVAAAAVESCDASLSIKDGLKFSSKADRGIGFFNSKFENLAYGDRTNQALQSAADYLKNNSERNLVITGRYDSDETYDGILTDLGLARATSAKNALSAMGAPTSQIDLKSVRDESLCYRGDTIANGVGFAFSNAATTAAAAAPGADDRLAKIKERLYAKPITLYFDTDSDNLSVSSQQRQDFADLSYYLDKVSDASLAVGGHTDSQGDSRYNMQLSRDRAKFVRSYIIKRAGINADRMSSDGFGEAKPVATNSTSAGRAKNRRVEVVLK